MKGRVDIVKELVCACPQSVKEVTICGETVLHVAVKSNQAEAVKVLLEEIKKLDMMEIVNWKDKDGNTIMHLATLRKQHEVRENYSYIFLYYFDSFEKYSALICDYQMQTYIH